MEAFKFWAQVFWKKAGQHESFIYQLIREVNLQSLISISVYKAG